MLPAGSFALAGGDAQMAEGAVAPSNCTCGEVSRQIAVPDGQHRGGQFWILMERLRQVEQSSVRCVAFLTHLAVMKQPQSCQRDPACCHPSTQAKAG